MHIIKNIHTGLNSTQPPFPRTFPQPWHMTIHDPRKSGIGPWKRWRLNTIRFFTALIPIPVKPLGKNRETMTVFVPPIRGIPPAPFHTARRYCSSFLFLAILNLTISSIFIWLNSLVMRFRHSHSILLYHIIPIGLPSSDFDTKPLKWILWYVISDVVSTTCLT